MLVLGDRHDVSVCEERLGSRSEDIERGRVGGLGLGVSRHDLKCGTTKVSGRLQRCNRERTQRLHVRVACCAPQGILDACQHRSGRRVGLHGVDEGRYGDGELSDDQVLHARQRDCGCHQWHQHQVDE